MPNPKRRHSQQRSAKRRTHYVAQEVTLSKDGTTGETHLRHRAHVSEGKLYYKGKLVAEKAPLKA
ncbi:MAG TPA: 50S ribosomal protein L32 [Arachidicoccus soli]|uniref:Large ribosomal subunit protein bL32 n=1 Tax=Arachidicoccus soli TaxID=2341117 RepID=A0A386HT00_9BACT|nr:50S ribosomal protein L32 [Arachidicoccus soli]AYD48636.1 50S ribosomal protein L32 [Arachidicoccus soli]HEU0226740.1 50S ribosomal protein L32 [Arachidicoccus soli]